MKFRTSLAGLRSIDTWPRDEASRFLWQLKRRASVFLAPVYTPAEPKDVVGVCWSMPDTRAREGEWLAFRHQANIRRVFRPSQYAACTGIAPPSAAAHRCRNLAQRLYSTARHVSPQRSKKHCKTAHAGTVNKRIKSGTRMNMVDSSGTESIAGASRAVGCAGAVR